MKDDPAVAAVLLFVVTAWGFWETRRQFLRWRQHRDAQLLIILACLLV
jgi:hypothetical protein